MGSEKNADKVKPVCYLKLYRIIQILLITFSRKDIRLEPLDAKKGRFLCQIK